MARRVVLAGLGALAATGARAEEASADASPLVINALGGLDDPNLGLAPRGGLDPAVPVLTARALRDARAAGLSAVNVTIGYVSGPRDPYAESLGAFDAWDRLLAQRTDALLKVLTGGDLARTREDGRVGVILGFQNGVQLLSPGAVEVFARRGLRVAQLTYNPANPLGDGAMAPLNRGLTPLGLEVIDRLNAARVMVDLSHSGERTCVEATRASRAPISINHTGCRALTDLPRNKTDAELRGVAEGGGFVGIYFMPYLAPSGHARAADVVRHILHAVNVCGEDAVGIGTDGSTTPVDDLDAYRAHLAAEVEGRARAGIGAAGERADTFPFVVDLRGPDQFRRLAGLLLDAGLSERQVEKILGLNFLAFARRVWDD
jgi:membrane dipeptidase